MAQWPRDSADPPGDDLLARLGGMRARILRQVGISGWQMNAHESAAMWSFYLKSDEGVAIQSTFRRLTDAFGACGEAMHVGVAQYIDCDSEIIPWGHNVLSPFVYTRLSFAFECEVRAVVWRPPIDGQSPFAEDYGTGIPIELGTLVERISVAPSAPRWFDALVRSVLGRYGFDVPVEHSRLGESPIF